MALTADEEALRSAREALRLVRVSLPHLAGVAALVRLAADARVPTAAVTASGRVLVNPAWFPALPPADRVFAMAYELLHLCLRTHDRADGADHEQWNWAHDYIINDMLRQDLGRGIPAGGLSLWNARDVPAERLVEMIKRGELDGPHRRRRPPPGRSAMGQALAAAGLLPPEPSAPPGDDVMSPGSGDVLTDRQERELFPGDDPRAAAARRRQVAAAARHATALEVVKATFDAQAGGESGGAWAVAEALRVGYRPPWEPAVQRWLDAVAPGPRTYARPPRRGADRADVVLPGRRREGWTLHVVLDTSGSMVSELPRMLGALAAFAEGAGVADVRVVQCDAAVTGDEWVGVEALAQFPVAGFGGSDMSPTLDHLAADPEVEAAVVLTDGAIDYPAAAPPFAVLWCLDDERNLEYFAPPYGTVVALLTE